MSFQKLHDVFLEKDWEFDLLIDDASLSNGNLVVNFRITRGSNDQTDKWVLREMAHRESRISLGIAAGISLEVDHPLLWKYSHYQCELHMSGQCAAQQYKKGHPRIAAWRSGYC